MRLVASTSFQASSESIIRCASCVTAALLTRIVGRPWAGEVGEERADLVRVGDVAADDLMARTDGGELGPHLVGVGGGVAPGDGHVGPGRGECERDGTPDAARAAGHEGPPPGERGRGDERLGRGERRDARSTGGHVGGLNNGDGAVSNQLSAQR